MDNNKMPENLDDFLTPYQLPDNVPQEVEGDIFQYHKNPAGWYYGVIGKLNFKFQDINGKKCAPDTPGAVAVRAVLRIFNLRYLGTKENPQKQQIMDIEKGAPVKENPLPEELYSPLILSLKKKDQWKAFRLFESFKLDEFPDSEIVKDRRIRYNKFPLYFGKLVKFRLEEGKNMPYVAEIILLDTQRIDPKIVLGLEEYVDSLIQKNLDERKREREGDVVMPGPDMTVDDIFSRTSPDIGEYDDELPI